MFKKFILCCILSIIIKELILGQCEASGIFDVFFNDQVLIPREIAQKAGYSAESHKVVTQDGYILLVDRIAGSKKSPPSHNKTAVLLLHGILDCSITWIAAGPGVGLGYILADQGYDVWLGNVRGNRFSRKHLNLTTSDAEFWMFSWHEIGMYDLPAMIDYITEQTEQEKIFMVTHSQGGTTFLVMASERPVYQEKIIAVSALAPAAFLSRARPTLLKLLFLVANDDDWILSLLGIYQVKPFGSLVQSLESKTCSPQSLLVPGCKGLIDLFFGYHGNLETSSLHLVSQYGPAGASVKQFAHYGQLAKSGKFRKFDYGVAGNMKKYGQAQPPDYNDNVSVPIAVYYGTNDAIITAQDVQELYEKLPSGKKSLIQIDTYAHLDFVWGKKVNTLVYDKILKFMAQHRK